MADFAEVPDEAAAPLGAMIMDESLSSRVLPLLVDMGKRAAPAVPHLAEALEYEGGKVAYNAAFALSRIGAAAAPAVDALTTALDTRTNLSEGTAPRPWADAAPRPSWPSRSSMN